MATKNNVFLKTVFLCVLLFLGSICLISLVNSYVPLPYMDEIFHVDQVQRYCAGRYGEWNPKITTPPGLYLVSLLILRPVISFSTAETDLVCSVQVLRLLNALLYSVIYMIVAFCFAKNWKDKQAKNAPSVPVVSLAVVLFPVLFSTLFLYYTDVISVLCVLAMYALQKSHLHVFSATFGALACLVRQTNIVWLVFCAGLTVNDIVQAFLDSHEKRKSGGVQRGVWSTCSSCALMWRQSPHFFLRMLTTVFGRVSLFFLVILVFGVVVVANGGLALGDKTAHQVVLHFPQLYYWAAFSVAMAVPNILRPEFLGLLRNRLWRSKRLAAVAAVLMALTIFSFTYDHPYLLADNRHFTFYIWRRWFMRHPIMKFLPIPIYLACLFAVAESISGQPAVWRLGFFSAVALVTIPNRLLEFRYFIIPSIIWRISINQSLQTRDTVFIELLLVTCVNIVTFLIFLFMPFQWPNEKGLQRFMW